jgi:hypothetical protein
MGMLYVDILVAKHDAKMQIEKMEKLRQQILKEREDKK